MLAVYAAAFSLLAGAVPGGARLELASAPSTPGLPAGPEAPAAPSMPDLSGPMLEADGPSPSLGGLAPGDLPDTSADDIPPTVDAPPLRPRQKLKPNGSTSAELRFVLDTNAKFRTRVTLGYSELTGPRLDFPWLNTVTAGNYVDFELGSVDPRLVSQVVEKSSYLQLVPWSVGWTLALGHNPWPWRKFATKPLSSSLRLFGTVTEMHYRDPDDLQRHREFRVPTGLDFKVQLAPFAYFTPLLLARNSALVRNVNPLDGILLYAAVGLDHGWNAPRKVAQWCKKPSGATEIVPPGSSKPAALQTCNNIFTGAVTEDFGVSGTLYTGYMDPNKNIWRVMLGPSFTYTRDNLRPDDKGALSLALAMPVRVDLAALVGGDKSPLRGIVELKPSLRASSQNVGKLDDYGFMLEMTLYLQQVRTATGLTLM